MPMRYSDSDKRLILDFVKEYDKKKGRGGKFRATKQFDVSLQTISNWLKEGKSSIVRKKSFEPSKSLNKESNISLKVMSHIENIDNIQRRIDVLRNSINSEKEAILKLLN